MRRGLILGLLLGGLTLLPGCGSRTDGAFPDAKPTPVDESVLAPCPRPEAYLGVDDWEIMAGRLGDALILCGEKQAILAANARGL